VPRSRLRQWSRTAFALAALFASFPVAARLFLGAPAFDEGLGIAGLCLVVGAYLYIRSRRRAQAPDPAALLDEAIRLVSVGDTRRARRLLDRLIGENPRFWQARQARGEVRMMAGEIGDALDDFDEAIRLAPEEPHLRELHAHAEALLREI
jgi:tetratricopeptide (TPR) repeat protein